MGLTIIIADGDSGAVDLGPPPMSQTHCTPLHADWPSQSQFVTAISSTYITPYATPICYLDESLGGVDCNQQPLGEVAVGVNYGMRWTTGGGFSIYSSRPTYQQSAVSNYLNQTQVGIPPSNVFNANGRAYPECATVGHNLMVAYQGIFFPVDGTSASAPIF